MIRKNDQERSPEKGYQTVRDGATSFALTASQSIQ
jgi:hypothetical protein